MQELRFTGLDPIRVRDTLATGTDHAGNPIEPFTDEDGGWPLRCCLADSEPGDEIAIIAWTPFAWSGAYAETGPVVLHTSGCPGPADVRSLPGDLDARAMTLRPYGRDRRIAYAAVRHVPEGQSLTAHLNEMLSDDAIEMVHGRNVTGGCFSFAAHRDVDGRSAGS